MRIIGPHKATLRLQNEENLSSGRIYPRRLGGPKSQFGRFGKKKETSCPCQDMNIEMSRAQPAPSLGPSTLSQLQAEVSKTGSEFTHCPRSAGTRGDAVG
jgi:hypothetical protein